jgi:hypothetical protein
MLLCLFFGLAKFGCIFKSTAAGETAHDNNHI